MSEVVIFTPPDLDEVLRTLDPAGWVNLQPEVDEKDLPPAPSGFFAVFGNRGPLVPFSTWHPGERLAGVQHAGGQKVAERLDVPAGWRVTQDHPMRGLVVAVPVGVADAEVLAWLVGVAGVLCPVPGTGRWVAELYS